MERLGLAGFPRLLSLLPLSLLSWDSDWCGPTDLSFQMERHKQESWMRGGKNCPPIQIFPQPSPPNLWTENELSEWQQRVARRRRGKKTRHPRILSIGIFRYCTDWVKSGQEGQALTCLPSMKSGMPYEVLTGHRGAAFICRGRN